MNLTRARLKFLSLAKERFRLEKELLKRRPMLGGPLIQTHLTCGKGGCQCKQRDGKKHGPYAYVQLREGDRYTHRYIQNQPKLIRLAGNYSEFIRTLAKVRSLGREMDRLLVIIQQQMIEEVKRR